MLTRLAVGGMAELFVARTVGQHGFEKLVALKRILAAHAEDEQFINMLLAEARLAATLHHPNIAQVYDVGEVDGTYFFTMEYVFGQDLRQIVRAVQARGSWFSPEHILQIVIGTAAGLHYAHESEDSDGSPRGVVHRDVSPSNILVSFDGSVKLVDFGIARVNSLQSTTGLGALKGKVPYMSPEQCRGEPLDRRSDIFSLGIMLWELTVRRRLYSGPNDLVVAAKICGEDAPLPTSIDPDYPPALERIVVKALARDRDQRYATAEELQLDLEEYARENMLLMSSAKLGHFMTDLFADLIKGTKSTLRERIASSTGIFPAYEEPATTSSASMLSPRLPSHPGTAAATGGGATIGTSNSEMSLTRPEAEQPSSRRPLYLYLGIGAGGLLALILAMSLRGGEPPVAPAIPAPTPTPAAATATVAPVAPSTVLATPTPPAVAKTPDVAPEPEPTAVPEPESQARTTKPKLPKKRADKPTKQPTWDPDSPILPP